MVNRKQADRETDQTLAEVVQDIARGKASPCYLLYGTEEFLMKEALEKILPSLIPPQDQDLNLFSLDGEREDIATLCDLLLTAPLIPGRKVVVVHRTHLFHSKQTLPDIIKKIRSHFENDPAKVAGDFLRLLKLIGWHLEDLQEEGWKKITDDAWNRLTGGNGGEGREIWLPRMVDYCTLHERESSQRSDESERLIHVLKAGLPENHHLILTAEAVDRSKKIFKAIAETGRILAFLPAKGHTRQTHILMDIAMKRLAQSGKTLTREAWNVIGQKTGLQIRSAVEAIEKLITYAGERTTIDAADVEEVIGRTAGDSAFDLTAAMTQRNLKQGLSILSRLLVQGEPPILILNLLTREIRHLVHARLLMDRGPAAPFDPAMDYIRFKDTLYPAIKASVDQGRDGTLVSQHPYVVYLALKNASSFRFDALARYLKALADMDVILKTTGKDPKLLLERFLVAVCSEK